MGEEVLLLFFPFGIVLLCFQCHLNLDSMYSTLFRKRALQLHMGFYGAFLVYSSSEVALRNISAPRTAPTPIPKKLAGFGGREVGREGSGWVCMEKER